MLIQTRSVTLWQCFDGFVSDIWQQRSYQNEPPPPSNDSRNLRRNRNGCDAFVGCLAFCICHASRHRGSDDLTMV